MTDPILCDIHAEVLRNAARQHDHDPGWLADTAQKFSRACCQHLAGRVVHVQTWVGSDLTHTRSWRQEDWR